MRRWCLYKYNKPTWISSAYEKNRNKYCNGNKWNVILNYGAYWISYSYSIQLFVEWVVPFEIGSSENMLKQRHEVFDEFHHSEEWHDIEANYRLSKGCTYTLSLKSQHILLETFLLHMEFEINALLDFEIESYSNRAKELRCIS